MMNEKCTKCGCTYNNPCWHPKYGFCWWTNAEHTLCSHCSEKKIKDDPKTVHCVNNIPDWKPREE